MELEYFAALREITGRSKQPWNANMRTVGDLLRELSASYGEDFRHWVLNDDGSLAQMCIILVNGHDIRESDGLATLLHQEDSISFFPPLAGG